MTDTTTTTGVATQPVLEVRNLVTEFPIRAGVFRREVGRVQAVSDVSFDLMHSFRDWPAQALIVNLNRLNCAAFNVWRNA